jgi:hypothetical protein
MAFKQVNTNDQNLQLIQDNISAAIQPIDTAPLTRGNLLTNLPLTSGSNSIAHKLGKVPTRWVITDIDAAVTVYRSSWDNAYINLTASGACTISLWVN